MTEASDLAKYASKANAVFNSISANSTAITSMSVGGASINATSFAGTANNATNLGGVVAASYQLNSTLSANVATLAANSSSYANASVTNTFTVGTSAYFVSNGNVGIGTSSPTYELTVNGGTLGTTLNGTVNAFQVYASSNNADYLNFYKIRQTAANSSWETAAWRIQQVVDTTSQGYIQFNGSSATDTISFGTGNTERMRISANGNVGIGTSSPAYKLDVYSTSGDSTIASRSAASGAGIFRAVGSNTTFAAYNALISTEFSGTQQWYLGGDGVANTIIIKTGTTERMRIDSNGNVGIGNTAPTQKLHVQGTAFATSDFRAPIFYDSDDTNSYFEGPQLFMRGSSPTMYFRDTDHNSAMIHVNSNLFYVLRGATDSTTWTQVNGQWPLYINLTNNDNVCGGTFYAAGNIVAYSSDKRLKENIKEIPNAIEKLKKIRGVTFDWNDKIDSLGFTPKQKYNDVGVIAQEIEDVMPQVVSRAPFDVEYDEADRSIIKSKSGEDYKTVQYERIVPLLIQAIKEQQAQIEALQAKIMGN